MDRCFADLIATFVDLSLERALHRSTQPTGHPRTAHIHPSMFRVSINGAGILDRPPPSDNGRARKFTKISENRFGQRRDRSFIGKFVIGTGERNHPDKNP